MKSHIRTALLGLTALAAAATPAMADPINRTYTVHATFNGAPITDWDASFTVQFDTDVAPSFATLTDGLTVNNVSTAYDGSVGFNYSADGSELVFSNNGAHNFGGFTGGGLNPSGNGFLLFIENASSATPQSWSLDFTNGDGNDYVARSVSVSFTDNAASSPAPEPASWAMMLGGFGLVGGALRSRKRAVRFA